MKPIFIILPILALFMIGGIVVTEQDSSDAQTQTWTSGNCTVTMDDNGIVTVSGNGAMQDYASQSDQPWYSARASMTKLIIHDGVTGIGNNCFRGTSICSIDWPSSSLKSIWHNAFLGSGLIWVSLPNSITTWGNSIFQNCSSLSQVELPSNMTAIPQSMFMNCSALGSISIPTSVETIGISAFNNCGLTSIYIPDEVETIGNYAFQGCSNLAFARVGMGYDGESNGVFAQCTSLTMVAFAEGLFKIGEGMFNGCTSLQQPVLPFTLRTIGQDAFRNCTALTIVVMSPSITSIGNNAFNATALGRIVFQGTTWNNPTIGTNAFVSTGTPPINVHSGGNCANGKLDGKGGNTYLYVDLGTTQSWTSGSCTLTINPISGLMTISGNGAMLDYPSTGSVPWKSWNGGTLIRAIKVGSGVTKIGNNAFYNDTTVYTGLNRVYWDSGGASNLTIGENAFRKCYTLERVSLPSSCIGVGDNAFNGCRGVRTLELPAQLTSIGEKAFNSMHSLTDLNLNLYTGSWNFDIWNYANSLKNITVASANTAYSSNNGMLYTKDGQTLKVVPFGRVTCTVPSSAYYIDSNCARGGLLGKITIPNSVNGVGGQAFVGCTRLTSLELPDNCTGVSSIAFADCNNVKEIYLHGSSRYTHTPGSNAFNLNRNSSSTPITVNVYYDGQSSAEEVRNYLGTFTNLTWNIQEAVVIVTIVPDIASYGSVSVSEVRLPYNGGTATIDGNRINIGGTWVTATPASATAQYTYTFGNWSGVPSGGTITEDCTITANFTRTTNEYTVTFQVNDDEFGTVSPTTVTVPYGTQIQTSSMNPNTLTIGGNTITATRSAWTPGAKYYFDNWSGIPSPAYVTGAVTITANFHKEAVSYTLTFNVEPLGYGSVSPSTVTAEYGTPITVEGNNLRIGDTTVTPIPLDPTSEWVYTFHHWRNLPETVTGDTSVMGVFTREARQYTVTFQADPEGLGTISPGTVTAEYGTPITVQDNTITIDGTTVTATPLPPTEDYKYVFVTWVNYRPTVTGDMTIIGNFERLDIFTVTYDPNGGTITSPESSERVAYGEYADLASFTAEKEGWVFIGWNSDDTQTVPLTEYRVTGETTLYAVYSEIVVYDIPAEEYIDGLTHTEYGQGGIMSILLMIIPLMLGLGIVMYLAQSMGIRVGRRRSRHTQAGHRPRTKPLTTLDFSKCF